MVNTYARNPAPDRSPSSGPLLSGGCFVRSVVRALVLVVAVGLQASKVSDAAPPKKAAKPADPTAVEGPEAEQNGPKPNATGPKLVLGDRGSRVDSPGGTLAREGATTKTEASVDRGLRWLLAHQQKTGAWRFDMAGEPCNGQCRNPGSVTTTTAATALALLAFLGAGQTPRDGEYQNAVTRGFYYLSSRATQTNGGLNLCEGTMYGQGLSAIAFCEAYAMTGDELLKDYAQRSIRYIVYAQDPKGGGWRYMPGEPGDITVTGWQILALKSAEMAGLTVPSPTWEAAVRFLNSVQADGGAQYGYMDPKPKQTTTSIGLLSRMYTGWLPTDAPLRRGVTLLAGWKPSKTDMYYNFYATQVMHHWGGSEWDRWNRSMRDFLIQTQSNQGHEAGSWHFDGGHGDRGGRLYNTAINLLTLEVYYRYLPLFRAKPGQSR